MTLTEAIDRLKVVKHPEDIFGAPYDEDAFTKADFALASLARGSFTMISAPR